MKQVAVLGCGAWGTAVSRLIAENVKDSKEFAETVMMYVYNETYCGESLADVINHSHVNPAHFPGFEIPENVVASCDLKEIVSHSDILAVVYPPRHVPWLLDNIQAFVGSQSYFITFCKGVVIDQSEEKITIISDLIREKTKRPCVAVIGATTALEVGWRHFTEATIGSTDIELAKQTKRLLQTDYFRLVISTDAVGVELCGALKHVVAIAAGIADGLHLGDNTRSAILRLGFWEMFEIMEELFPNRGVQKFTIEQSCGIAEVFVCMSHRSAADPVPGSDMELLNVSLGRVLAADCCDPLNPDHEKIHGILLKLRSICVNGAEYAAMIYSIMKKRNLLSKFPLFTAVHLICEQTLRPSEFIEQLRTHPVHV